MALQIGIKRQQEFLKSLGFFEPTDFEIVEARTGKPLLPKRWTELSAVTVSYGHGLSSSPMHLAAGYAAIANGGRLVKPTILKQNGPRLGDRVMSEGAARAARDMLRKVVTDGHGQYGRGSWLCRRGQNGHSRQAQAARRVL